MRTQNTRKTSALFTIMFLLVGGIFLLANPLPARAEISSGVVAGNAAADLVVGTSDADYNTTFRTNTTSTANTITVTFPSGYVITNNSYTLSNVNSVINNNNGGGSVVAGMINVNGVNWAVNNVVFNASARTVAITVDAYNLSVGTTTFRLLTDITNATTSGATGTFTITTDAIGETPQANVAAVTFTPGTATQIVFTTQPAASVSGVSLTQPVVTARDTYGNTDTNFTETITLTENGAGNLSGTVATTSVSGVATFSGIKYLAAVDGESFIITATGDTLHVHSNSVASNVIATELIVDTQPDSIISGVSMHQPIIKYVDLNHKVDTAITTGDTITISKGSAAGTIAGTTTVSATEGIAIFSGLIYTAVLDQESVTFVFTDNTDGGGAINAAPVNAATTTANVVATALAINTQPSTIVSGVSMVVPIVRYVDLNNATDTDVTVDILAATTNAAGSITAVSTTTVSSGVATFTSMEYKAFADQEAVQFIFTDDTGNGVTNITPVTSATTTADVVATKIIVDTEPDSIVSGVSMHQPIIKYVDADNKVDTAITTSDTVTITKGSAAGSIAGTATVSATTGVVTFSGLTYLANADEEDVTFVFTDNELGAKNFNSSPVNAATTTANVLATGLTIFTQPTSTISGVSMTPSVVRYVDAQGKIDTHVDTDVLTAIDNAAGEITAVSTTTAQNGVATFTGMKYKANADQEEFQLIFTDDESGLVNLNATPAVSASTTADVVATQLVVTTPPAGAVDEVALTTQPSIQAQNANGTLDTGASTETITATTDTSNVSLSSATATMTSGIATFSGLKANVDGAFTDGASMNISFDDDGNLAGLGNMAAITSTTSLDVVLTQIVLTTSPSGAVDLVNLTTQPVVKAYDAHNNTDTGINGEVITASITTSNVSAVGNTTSTMTSGVATFAGLQASVDGTFTDDDVITFSFNDDGSMGGVDAAAVTATTTLDVLATKLVISGVSSLADNPNVRFADNITATVTAKDAHSNTDPDDVSTFSFAMADSTADPLTLSANTGTLVAGTKQLTTMRITAANLSATTPDGDTLSLTASDTGVGSTLTTSVANTTLAINYIYSALSVDCTTTPTTGTAVDVTVSAVDANSNIDNAYTGTVMMSSSSTSPTWHTPWYTFVSGNQGTKVLSGAVTFSTAQSGITVTARDLSDASINGTKSGITASSGNGSLAVTSITTKESYASAGGGWPDGVASTTDGWSWTFNVTVPTSETTFKMKFDNWTSGSNTIAVADNMRFYSAQSSNASTTGSAISITTASTLSSGMTLTGDTDSSAAGRQIQVTVEAKVPTGSSGGSYSTSYGITSS
jgi:hypothetical protein